MSDDTVSTQHANPFQDEELYRNRTNSRAMLIILGTLAVAGVGSLIGSQIFVTTNSTSQHQYPSAAPAVVDSPNPVSDSTVQQAVASPDSADSQPVIPVYRVTCHFTGTLRSAVQIAMIGGDEFDATQAQRQPNPDVCLLSEFSTIRAAGDYPFSYATWVRKG